jgi:hypothetical protein
MTYNSTTQLWTQTIPGQSNNTDAVEFFIQAYDNLGNMEISSLCTFQIKHLLPGDMNGNGSVDLSDLVIMAQHYGQSYP